MKDQQSLLDQFTSRGLRIGDGTGGAAVLSSAKEKAANEITELLKHYAVESYFRYEILPAEISIK